MQDKTKSKKARNYGLFLLYTITFIVPVGGLVGLYGYFQKQLDDIPEARIIVVSKQDMRLRVYDYKGTRLMDYGIACGKNFGQKHKEIQGAYGPYFIRLDTPGNKGIGIHGTHDPLSIGTRATEGCIRLNNNDLVELVNVVRPGMMVLVTTSFEDYEQEQQYIGNKRDSVKNQ